MGSKAPEAFRTISEVAEILETPPHVLRFWESKFTQVRPVKRAGGRRYYRPSDLELLAGIKQLLHEDGMTIRGVQKLLREQGVKHVSAMGSLPTEDDREESAPQPDTVQEDAAPEEETTKAAAPPAADSAASTPEPRRTPPTPEEGDPSQEGGPATLPAPPATEAPKPPQDSGQTAQQAFPFAPGEPGGTGTDTGATASTAPAKTGTGESGAASTPRDMDPTANMAAQPDKPAAPQSGDTSGSPAAPTVSRPAPGGPAPHSAASRPLPASRLRVMRPLASGPRRDALRGALGRMRALHARLAEASAPIND